MKVKSAGFILMQREEGKQGGRDRNQKVEIRNQKVERESKLKMGVLSKGIAGFLSKKWCGREELNLHDLSATRS